MKSTSYLPVFQNQREIQVGQMSQRKGYKLESEPSFGRLRRILFLRALYAAPILIGFHVEAALVNIKITPAPGKANIVFMREKSQCEQRAPHDRPSALNMGRTPEERATNLEASHNRFVQALAECMQGFGNVVTLDGRPWSPSGAVASTSKSSPAARGSARLELIPMYSNERFQFDKSLCEQLAADATTQRTRPAAGRTPAEQAENRWIESMAGCMTSHATVKVDGQLWSNNARLDPSTGSVKYGDGDPEDIPYEYPTPPNKSADEYRADLQSCGQQMVEKMRSMTLSLSTDSRRSVAPEVLDRIGKASERARHQIYARCVYAKGNPVMRSGRPWSPGDSQDLVPALEVLLNNAKTAVAAAETARATVAEEARAATAAADARRAKILSDPNRMTLFGITIGLPLDLPVCPAQSRDLSANRHKGLTQPCQHEWLSDTYVYVSEHQASAFSWLTDASVGMAKGTSPLLGALYGIGGGFGDLKIIKNKEGNVVMIEMWTSGTRVESDAIESLTQKFGPPVSRELRTYTNANGAQRKLPVITWRKSGVQATLEYGGNLMDPFGLIGVFDENALKKARESNRPKETM